MLPSGFAANVRVGRDGREMDGKSIMGLLLLSASRGTAVTISADGADEREALEALCALVVRGFDEVAVDGVHGGPFGVQGGPVGGTQGPVRGNP